MNSINYKMFINGCWVSGENDGEKIIRENPSTGKVVSTYINGSRKDVDNASSIAKETLELGIWSDLPRPQKASYLLKIAHNTRLRLEELAKIESSETGKSFDDACMDITNGIKYWEFAAAAVRLHFGEYIDNIQHQTGAFTSYSPVGVVAVILPWNFPFIVLSERLPFMLGAGCAVVAKPSEYASGTCLVMGEILKDSGIPDGVYNILTGTSDAVGQPLVEHKDIAMVSFTGSTENGRKVMESASKTLKKVSLELGGKSPVILFADCDIDKAVSAIIAGFTENAGQCCIATSRLLIEESIYKIVMRKLTNKIEDLDFEQSLANKNQFEKVKSFIKIARNSDKIEIFGGNIDEERFFISPAIVESKDYKNSLYSKEIFGPILSVLQFNNEKNAIDLANDTNFGLAACIWTSNMNKAKRIINKINAGRFWVNSKQVNFPELPVGGVGQSGVGREAGMQGIIAYSEVKSIIYNEK